MTIYNCHQRRLKFIIPYFPPKITRSLRMSEDPPPENASTSTIQGQSSIKSYPKPEADFQEVVQNPLTFLQKLQSCHSYLGTKFR